MQRQAVQQEVYDQLLQRQAAFRASEAAINDDQTEYPKLYREALASWIRRSMRWDLFFEDTNDLFNRDVHEALGFYNIRVQQMIWNWYQAHIFGTNDRGIERRPTARAITTWWYTLAGVMGVVQPRPWDILYPAYGMDHDRPDATLACQVMGSIVRLHILTPLAEMLYDETAESATYDTADIIKTIKNGYLLIEAYLVTALSAADEAAIPSEHLEGKIQAMVDRIRRR